VRSAALVGGGSHSAQSLAEKKTAVAFVMAEEVTAAEV
jgi:hypothetical protein